MHIITYANLVSIFPLNFLAWFMHKKAEIAIETAEYLKN